MPVRPPRMGAGSTSAGVKQETNNNNTLQDRQTVNNNNSHHHANNEQQQQQQIRITHTTGSAPLPSSAAGFNNNNNTNTIAATNLNNNNNNNNLQFATMTLPAGMTMEMIKQQAMAAGAANNNNNNNNNINPSKLPSSSTGNITFVTPTATATTPPKATTFLNANADMNNNNNNNGDGFVVVADGKLRVGKDGISIVDAEHSDIPEPSVHIEDLIEERILDRSNDTVVALYRRREPSEYENNNNDNNNNTTSNDTQQTPLKGDGGEKEKTDETTNTNNNNNNNSSATTSSTKKERYAVKILQIKNKRDTLHIVAAEVGSAFMNRSDFTVTLKNAYLRGSQLILIMEYMDGRSLFDLLKNLQELGRTMKEDAVAYVTHRMLLALRMLHEGLLFQPPSSKCNGGGHMRQRSLSGKNHSRNLSTGSNNSSFAVSPAGAGTPLMMSPQQQNNNNNNSNAASSPTTIKRVVHRDIKPSNILLNSSGAVKLADFGVAGSTDSIGLATFVGTVNYMCPERIQGRGYNTPSDIWSLGVVVAEMLLGYHPFLAASPATSTSHTSTSGTNSGMTSLQNNNNNQQQQHPPNVSPAPMNGAGPQFPGMPSSFHHLPSASGGSASLGNNSNNGGGGGNIGFCELFERVTKCNGYNIGPGFTDDAVDFVKCCLQQDPDKRPSAAELVKHPWIARFGDTMTICPNSGLANRMMSNSASSFTTTTTSAAPSSVFSSATNNNNNKVVEGGVDSNANNNGNNLSSTFSSSSPNSTVPQHPSSSSIEPPMDSNDFAHYVYDIRKDARDKEAEKKRAERHEQRRREKLLAERQNNNNNNANTSSSGSKNSGMTSNIRMTTVTTTATTNASNNNNTGVTRLTVQK